MRHGPSRSQDLRRAEIWSDHSAPGVAHAKRGYHHGNLRQALVEAALRPDRGKGADRLHPVGGREAGRCDARGRLPPFRGARGSDRGSARQGYEIFADLMDYAFERASPRRWRPSRRRGAPISPLRASIPAITSRCSKAASGCTRTPELAAAPRRNRARCWNAAEALSEHIPPDKRPPPSMFSAHIWAMSHGVVELFARGAPATQLAVCARGPAGGRDRHLPARAGFDPTGRIRSLA
jgi:hypothetical protein